MKAVSLKISIIFTCAAIFCFTAQVPGLSQDWEEGFPVRITYQELGGEDSGYADATLLMSLSAGTPLLGRETAINSALSALHDIWKFESVHENVRGFLGPVVPLDVQHAVSEIKGADFILGIIAAFDMVGDAGFSRFQVDTPVRSTERVPTRLSTDPRFFSYPDAPRYFAWVIGGEWAGGEMGHENWVIAALINYSASILSFRSENGRFPVSFAELLETNHVLIEPLNPYTSEPIRNVTTPTPGDIKYEYFDTNRVMLYAYIEVAGTIDVIRREINVASNGDYDLLYRQTAGLSEDDKQVARYTFQIAQILNEYYFQNLDLPFNVPQCEAEGFAYISFPNPFRGQDVQQSDTLAGMPSGNYTYHRISNAEYYLVGYGGSGEPVLRISEVFPVVIETTPLQAQ
ncbi:hypothetical protein KAU08_08255 [bacterium]|nr:hypothetical protein [bacterium]